MQTEIIRSVNTLNFSQGWQWINQGFRYFIQAKNTWVLTMLIIGVNLSFIYFTLPFAQLWLIFIFPFITVGLSLACSDLERGKPMTFEYIIKGFQHPNRINIFRYGLWFFLLMILSQLISSMALTYSGVSQEQVLAEFESLSHNKNATIDTIIGSPILFRYFAFSLIIMIPLSAISIFAPLILTFTNSTALDAIKYAVLAVTKNVPALLLYGFIYLVLIFIGYYLIVFVNFIFSMIFSEESGIKLWISLIMILLFTLVIAATTYCSSYVAFRNTFNMEKV